MHPRAAERLREDHVVWLTTINADGQPQSTPVWFVWDDGSFLIYSQATAPKLANIRANPRVSLHLDDNAGSEVATFEGEATIEDGAPRTDKLTAYAEKYREAIAGLGYDERRFAEEYSVAIRVRVTRSRILWF